MTETQTQPTKKPDPWYLSKRTYAGVIMLVAMVLGVFGYDIDQDLQANMTDILWTLAGGVAGALALWSKVKETKATKANGK
jgi:hypothetical protein